VKQSKKHPVEESSQTRKSHDDLPREIAKQQGPSHRERQLQVHLPSLDLHFPSLAELQELSLRPSALSNRKLGRLIEQLRTAADYLEQIQGVFRAYNKL
jgi:hypothetical protein